jgi:hypothetical protein
LNGHRLKTHDKFLSRKNTREQNIFAGPKETVEDKYFPKTPGFPIEKKGLFGLETPPVFLASFFPCFFGCRA